MIKSRPSDLKWSVEMSPRRALKRSVISSRSLDLHWMIAIDSEVHRALQISTVITPGWTGEIEHDLLNWSLIRCCHVPLE